MTVCIAAICNGGRIIGASDRMLTAGDIEFEPPQEKIAALTNSIVMMTAGDASLHTKILSRISNYITLKIQSTPNEWVKVKDVVDSYVRFYNEVRGQESESKILVPLGLDRNSFISRQREMNSDFINRTRVDLLNYTPEPVECIIAGVDTDGSPSKNPKIVNSYSHLYAIRGLDVSDYSNVGFCAIGIGRSHADSQFMFAGYSRKTSFAEALLLVYSSKKRAEVAPGVGRETDMFLMGPNLGSNTMVGPHVLKGLEGIYRRTQKRLRRADEAAKEAVRHFVDEISKAATPKPQESEKSSGASEQPKPN